MGEATRRQAVASQRARSPQGAALCPATIYDIGAYRGEWSRVAEQVFPAAACILFEANADNAVHLQASGRRHFTVAIADVDGRKTFFVPRAGNAVGPRSNTAYYRDENLVAREVATARLDTLVKASGLPPADLIKMDVQGAELDVIAGATDAIDRCDVLIVELSLASYNKGGPLVADVMLVIAQRGLRCIDVCELHRRPAGGVLQVDFLFVKPKLFDRFCAQLGLV